MALSGLALITIQISEVLFCFMSVSGHGRARDLAVCHCPLFGHRVIVYVYILVRRLHTLSALPLCLPHTFMPCHCLIARKDDGVRAFFTRFCDVYSFTKERLIVIAAVIN